MFCCGPAPVKAVRDRRIDLIYDIPFVYAEVNADVHSIVVSEGRVLGYSKDTEKVGSLICTKAIGHPRIQNITRDYKFIKSMSWKHKIPLLTGMLTYGQRYLQSCSANYNLGPTSTLTSSSSSIASEDSTSRRGNLKFIFRTWTI